NKGKYKASKEALIADIEATGATVHSDDLDPLVQLVQAQRLAVALAESRGLNPDLPRHLSRAVILN
ncbi:MAG: sugar isomerase, partial [Actinomycetota bacterium]